MAEESQEQVKRQFSGLPHFLPLNSCTASIIATMFSTGVAA
jgi:hypothetical protein